LEDPALGGREAVEDDAVRGVGETEALESSEDIATSGSRRAAFGKETLKYVVGGQGAA
jgi:hypothetical protein